MKISYDPIAIIFLTIFPVMSAAQCRNEIHPSCDVYKTCFENICKCISSNDEYFISFGKSYCEAFLGIEDLSETGKKWRDSTLRCLQEQIVQIIPINKPIPCDCSKAKVFALSTHVTCYTQPNASICDLSLLDLIKIVKTIIFNSAFIKLLKDRKEAYNQVSQVIEKCGNNARNDETKIIWNFFLDLIKDKVPQPTTLFSPGNLKIQN